MPDNHFRCTIVRANHVRTVINDLQYSIYNLFTIPLRAYAVKHIMMLYHEEIFIVINEKANKAHVR